MHLPYHLKAILRTGNQVVAPVPIDRRGWYAWIWVSPKMRSGLTYRQQLEEWTRTRLADGMYDDIIESFQIRYTELSEWHLQEKWAWDLDAAMKERPVEDWILEVRDEDTLLRVLMSRLRHLDDLKRPDQVSYPFPPTNWTKRIKLEDIL